MAIELYRKPDPILEIMPVDESIPSLSEFIGDEMGYSLYALEDKWVFPWKRTKVRLNIASMTMPHQTFGIVSENCINYHVATTKITGSYELYSVTVIPKRLLPFKIHKGQSVAFLSIIPYVECHKIEYKALKDKSL